MANVRQALDLIRAMLAMSTVEEEMRLWMTAQQEELEERIETLTEALELERLRETGT